LALMSLSWTCEKAITFYWRALNKFNSFSLYWIHLWYDFWHHL
jgi:hypothetical protein